MDRRTEVGALVQVRVQGDDVYRWLPAKVLTVGPRGWATRLLLATAEEIVKSHWIDYEPVEGPADAVLGLHLQPGREDERIGYSARRGLAKAIARARVNGWNLELA